MKKSILKKEIIKIFKKYGLNKNHALISANALINAELVGAFDHSTFLVLIIHDRMHQLIQH